MVSEGVETESVSEFLSEKRKGQGEKILHLTTNLRSRLSHHISLFTHDTSRRALYQVLTLSDIHLERLAFVKLSEFLNRTSLLAQNLPHLCWLAMQAIGNCRLSGLND